MNKYGTREDLKSYKSSLDLKAVIIQENKELYREVTPLDIELEK